MRNRTDQRELKLLLDEAYELVDQMGREEPENPEERANRLLERAATWVGALYLKDLADKTRRGLRGRIEAGKSGGGNSYGYDVVKKIDDNGEPVRGECRINPQQAAIVKRIFKDCARGISPRAIVKQLNREGVPSPSVMAPGAASPLGSCLLIHEDRSCDVPLCRSLPDPWRAQATHRQLIWGLCIDPVGRRMYLLI